MSLKEHRGYSMPPGHTNSLDSNQPGGMTCGEEEDMEEMPLRANQEGLYFLQMADPGSRYTHTHTRTDAHILYVIRAGDEYTTGDETTHTHN